MTDYSTRHNGLVGEGMHADWLPADPPRLVEPKDRLDVQSLAYSAEYDDLVPLTIGYVAVEARTADGYTFVMLDPETAEQAGMAMVRAAQHAREQREQRYRVWQDGTDS